MLLTLRKKTTNTLQVEEIPTEMTLAEAKAEFENSLYEVIQINPVINEAGSISNERACLILEKEGAGYATEHYCSGYDMIDTLTASKWNTVANAISDLKNHLNCK